MIKRTHTIEVRPTPEELGAEFASMSSNWQARFFNAVAMEVDEWEAPFEMEMQMVIDDPVLTDHGRFIMRRIGVYGEAAK